MRAFAIGLAVSVAACGRVGFADLRDAAPGTVDGTVVDGSAPRTDAPPRDPSLVAHYTLDSLIGGTTAHDDSGYGNRGSCALGACPTATAGQVGSAMAFDGISAELDVPSSPSLLTTSALTIGAWIDAKPVSDGKTHCFVSKPVEAINGDSWQLCIDGTGVLFGELQPGPGAGSVGLYSPEAIKTDTWQFTALTWDGTTETLYINNSAVGTAAISKVEFDSHPVIIGADSDGGAFTAGFAGAIDEVSIYNRALSPAEVTVLAEE